MKKYRKYFDLLLSLMFITSVILGYYKDISYMSEYCFMSGMTIGIIYFISFLKQQKNGTTFKPYIYLACMSDIFIIFIATLLLKLNLNGAFWFIHIINPIACTIYWFLFCNCKDMNWKNTAATIVFPILYMLFAFIIYKISGDCPFPARMIFVESKGIN